MPEMDGLPNTEVPSSGIMHSEHNTSAYVDDQSYGLGTLYITEEKVVWRRNDGKGLYLNYPHIGIHAISRDLERFPQECLFMILDIKLDLEVSRAVNDDDDSEDDESQPSTHLRFVPENKEQLDVIYQAMCNCQELHPDPDQDSEDDYYGDESIGGGGDGVNLSAAGMNNLARMEQMLSGAVNGHHGNNTENMDDEEGDAPGQFDDAEDEMEQ